MNTESDDYEIVVENYKNKALKEEIRKNLKSELDLIIKSQEDKVIYSESLWWKRKVKKIILKDRESQDEQIQSINEINRQDSNISYTGIIDKKIILNSRRKSISSPL